MDNKAIGTKFENEFAKLLFSYGFWVHNLTINSSGQPADILATKKRRAFLIDCKVASTNKGFELSRIEDNQYYAMQLWMERYGDDGWFAIKYKEGIIMITLYKLEYARHLGLSTITYEKALEIGITFERWIK